MSDEVKEVASTTAQPSGPSQTTSVKPGHRTTEFIAVGLVVVMSIVDEIHKMLDVDSGASPTALIAAGIAAGAYALSRALAKQQRR